VDECFRDAPALQEASLVDADERSQLALQPRCQELGHDLDVAVM
jgi:hypothetical protein